MYGLSRLRLFRSQPGPRFLVDANLSPRIAEMLRQHFPGSAHVSELSDDRGPLGSASDRRIADYAFARGMIVLTRDSDFRELQKTRLATPRVVRIDGGNLTTPQTRALLEERMDYILSFINDGEREYLMLKVGTTPVMHQEPVPAQPPAPPHRRKPLVAPVPR